ncbi:hypothetical protein PTTG_02020 [Puccinia triticina 1-1 BBBD Race 1]|uniref:Peptidase A2 domain-containing protein n=1 Tax=Puccinia triticina (isolate 1-1 / race 1 (BBBD)) TaxID=630390 RepID=A0A0C4EMN0_PUCT1|nr:hypothetical protein PTTG_02020 [Puccinia triticina 1-1 BBBD Race 1]
MIMTQDNRFKLLKFEILRKAVEEVMKHQTALTFEDSRARAPVQATQFQQSNDVMKKMESERRPKEAPAQARSPATMEDIERMFQSFEQRLEQKFAAQARPSTPRGPMVCYYCHREGHGLGRCAELQKDKEAKLVEQRGGSFFLPNGALIPVDSSRPIRHVVASYNPKAVVVSAPEEEFQAACGSLDPWSPPSISSQSFSGVYQSDPSKKKHEAPKPFKAPAIPPSMARRPLRKSSAPREGLDTEEMDAEPELFERIPAAPSTEDALKDDSAAPVAPKTPPKVRFKRGVSKDHPNAVDGMLKKMFDLSVPNVTVAELLAVAPSVAEGMKKWVSRRRMEVGPEELKVASGTLAEDSEGEGHIDGMRLYSCPLGYMPCLVGDEESNALPLIDSGSQLNLISNAMANKLNISPRVNFSSAVYGIGNQACELVGVAEDVPIRVGKTIIGSCHFWITRMDGPLIFGRPFLMDFNATLDFDNQVGERILLPDSTGRKIEVSLCSVDTGRWEREFPGHGRKAVLSHKGKARDDPLEGHHF